MTEHPISPVLGRAWTYSEARAALKAAKLALPGWRIAVHGSVFDFGTGRDLDLLVLPPPGASPGDLPAAMGAVEEITVRPDKRRFIVATGQVVDARIVGNPQRSLTGGMETP
jgi:hypothetical protein